MHSSSTPALGCAALLVLAACSAPTPPGGGGTPPASMPDAAPSAVAAPLSEAPAPDLAGVDGQLSLARLLHHARVHAPRIREAELLARAARQRGAQVTALPDPALRFGWFAEEVQTRTGPQRFAVGIAQRIPWPGRLQALGDREAVRAAMAAVRAWIVARDTLLEVANAYHELAHVERARGETAALESLWVRLLGLAAGKPGLMMPEIARAEIRLERARLELRTLDDLAMVERARIRALLGLASDAVVPSTGTAMAKAIDLSMELEELRELARESSQELLLASLAVDEAAGTQAVTEADDYPDLSFGARWIATGRRPDGATPVGNGADPLLFEFGVDLPLPGPSRSAARAEARLRTMAAAAARENRAARLEADVTRAFYRALHQQRLARLHAETLVPQADRAAREAEEAATSSPDRWTGLFETIALRHQTRLAASRADADLAQALLALERLLGTPLSARAISETTR